MSIPKKQICGLNIYCGRFSYSLEAPSDKYFYPTHNCVCFANSLVSMMMTLMVESGVSFQVILLTQITKVIYFCEKAFMSMNYLFPEN